MVRRWWCTAAVLALVACGDKDDAGPKERGSDDLGAGALRLIDAVKKGDDDAARRLLVAPHQCVSISALVAHAEEACKEMATEMLANLPAFRDTVKDFAPGTTREGELPGRATAQARRVYIEPRGGGKPIEVAAIELDGRFYYLLPRSKKAAPAQTMP